MQERRRYVPIGWCKFYDFSGADLRSGVDIIDGLAAGAEVDWPQLLGLLATAVYGGKIDNDPDTRILVEYLHLMFNDGTVGLRGQAPRPLPGAPRLTVPSSGKPSDMAVAAEGLPESDAPELFSLPANVQRTAQMKRARHVVHQMRAMDTRKEASGAIDLDKWRHKLGVLIRAWDALTRADQALGGVCPATPFLLCLQVGHQPLRYLAASQRSPVPSSSQACFRDAKKRLLPRTSWLLCSRCLCWSTRAQWRWSRGSTVPCVRWTVFSTKGS